MSDIVPTAMATVFAAVMVVAIASVAAVRDAITVTVPTRVVDAVVAVGNAVTVHVFVSAKVLARFQLLRGHDFTPVVLACLVPLEGLAQALVHADVQVGHYKNGGLQTVGQIQRSG